MNRLPTGIDLSFFNGQTFMQMCIGRHDLQLNFDEGVSISVESVIGIFNVHGAETRCEDLTKAASLLTDLLDVAVVSASGTLDGTLHLEFERGQRVSIYDTKDHYESYVIKHHGQVIVV